MISVPMDPREFAAKKLGRVRDGIGAATTSDERKVALKRAVTEFPLVVEFWLQFVDAAEDKRRAWDEAVSRCAHVQELWTAFLETATSAEDAKRAKDAVGSYFLSSSIWKTLLDRTADDTADRVAIVKEAIRVYLYDYAEFYQLASDLQAESYETLAEMAEAVGDVTTKRWEFESQLHRQEFSTDPLSDAELDVWNQHLDYFESLATKLGEFNPVRDCVQLYHKCLVVTALYPHFWRRFHAFLETHSLDSGDVLAEAVRYHPKNRSLRQLRAAYLEAHNHLDAARENLILDMNELVRFDLRHGITPSDDAAYLVAYNRATGNQVTPEMVAQAPELFETVADPITVFECWEQGLCRDVAAYAERLKAAGYLEAFFKVDSTL